MKRLIKSTCEGGISLFLIDGPPPRCTDKTFTPIDLNALCPIAMDMPTIIKSLAQKTSPCKLMLLKSGNGALKIYETKRQQMQTLLYKRRNEGYIKWMGAWKVRKREGAWNHDAQGSHLDSKRQPPLRKGAESFLHHQKESFLLHHAKILVQIIITLKY